MFGQVITDLDRLIFGAGCWDEMIGQIKTGLDRLGQV